jgi:adenylylsulfate kinase
VAYERLGFAIWITGLPASGKSMVTAALVNRLAKDGTRVTVLESDAMRRLFSDEERYDEQERHLFYSSLAFIGRLLTEHGINVIFDATANRRAYRDRARRQIPRFIEIFVDTPLEICMKRDPKGIYRKGQSGEAQNVPGLQARYEAPIFPDLIIHGDQESPEAAADRIVQFLNSKGF